MIKRVVLLLAVLIPVCFSFAAVPMMRPGEKQLKVMAWNIWHKGHLEKFGDKACQSCMGIMKASGADVILMVETYGSAPAVAKKLGFHYKLLSNNLCIFSRYPITKTYTFADKIGTFNFGGVEIDMNGTPVRLFDVWLHYLPDARLAPTDKPEEDIIAWEKKGSRHREIAKILEVMQPFIAESEKIPVIMGGDFNIHSHLDWTPATRNLYNHGGAVVRWPVSMAVIEAGFKDSFREIHPDPVKTLGVTWLEDAGEGVETTNRRDRIDFIYYQGKTIRAVASEAHQRPVGDRLTFKGRSFLYPSDHGFVLTTFSIAK